MALQIAPLIALKRRRPFPDGVLFAAGRMPQLILAGNNGTALSYRHFPIFWHQWPNCGWGWTLNRLNGRNICQTANMNFQKASAPALF
ncbi:hypothetical protein OAS14_01150 [Alphaproteobacteria bacterium]|nr:hypothetical protein [Alphaproteobacteria bacterium]